METIGESFGFFIFRILVYIAQLVNSFVSSILVFVLGNFFTGTLALFFFSISTNVMDLIYFFIAIPFFVSLFLYCCFLCLVLSSDSYTFFDGMLGTLCAILSSIPLVCAFTWWSFFITYKESKKFVKNI